MIIFGAYLRKTAIALEQPHRTLYTTSIKLLLPTNCFWLLYDFAESETPFDKCGAVVIHTKAKNVVNLLIIELESLIQNLFLGSLNRWKKECLTGFFRPICRIEKLKQRFFIVSYWSISIGTFDIFFFFDIFLSHFKKIYPGS